MLQISYNHKGEILTKYIQKSLKKSYKKVQSIHGEIINSHKLRSSKSQVPKYDYKSSTKIWYKLRQADANRHNILGRTQI